MANKALKEARKAYSKNKSTKYKWENGKKTKKTEKEKGKKSVASSYDKVKEKTQTAGKKGEENRKKASVKKAAGSVKSSLSASNATEKKVSSSWGSVSNTSQNKTFTDKKWTAKDVKNTFNVKSLSGDDKRKKPTTVSSHFGQVAGKATEVGKKHSKKVGYDDSDVQDYIGDNGTANGTEAGKAFNRHKTAEDALKKEGEKKVTTTKNGSLLYGIDSAMNQAAYMSKQPAEAAKFYDKEEKKAQKEGMTYGDKKEFIRKWVADKSNQEVLDAIDEYEKQRLADSSYTYTKAPTSTGDFFIRENASKYANTGVQTETNQPVYQTDKDGNIKYDKNGNPKVKKDKNGNVVYQKINSTQGNNILDYYGGGFKDGRLTNQNASTEVGNQTAGWIHDAPVAAGVMQGLSYSDITRGLGNYSNAAAKDLENTKNSTGFNVGYGIGQMGQFMLGGTGKMTDALVKGVTKAGAQRGALNIGIRKGLADVAFETPMNTLDALKMATDSNGNVDMKAFAKYMAMNTGISGGMGGLIGGVGTKLAKNDAKTYIRLTEKMKAGEDLSPTELKAFENVQRKLDSAMEGGDMAKGDVAANAKADIALSKADTKEYMSLRAKQNSGKITQQESARLASYSSMITQNFKEAQDNYARVLADAAGDVVNSVDEVEKAAEHFAKNGTPEQAAEAAEIATEAKKKYSVKDEARKLYAEADKKETGADGTTSSFVKPENVSDEYKQVYKEFTDSVDEELRQGVLNLREGKPAGFKQKDLGVVKDSEVDEISKLLGRDVHGYKRTIEADRLLHIDDRHGINGKENHTMMNANDIARAQYVMDNYDSISVPLKTDGTPKKSKQYTDSSIDGEPKEASPTIEYRKRVNGDFVVVEAVPDAATKELRVESMYFDTGKTKMAKKIDDSQKSDAITPPTDVRNEAGLTSKDNIPQEKETVKAEEPKVATPKETPEAEKPKTKNAEKTTAFKESEEYKTFKETPSKYASNRLKEMTDVADDYGVDVAPRIKEFNDLNKQIKEWKGKSKTSKTPEHIAEYKADIEAAEVRQTVIAESIYQDVARERLKVAGVDSTAIGEIRKATENIGGVDTMAKDIREANKGAGSKNAQKLVSEEMKDYRGCLEKYLKGDEDLDMQNARASALLDNIAERLSKNADDADAMDDLMKVTDKLSEDGTIPTSVRNSTYELMASTPKGRVGMALKTVEDLNKKYGERIDGTLKLTDEEKVKLATTTGEELDALYKEISERLWDNIPATRVEKLNEIRHMFMLLNVRTHGRNMLGNFSFRGIRKEADALEAWLQSRVFKNAIEKRGGEVDRVKVKKSDIRENQEYLDKEFHAIYDKSDSKTRWKETNRPDGVPTVKTKALNWLIQKDYGLLETEDMWTFIPAFRKSYMQYVNAKGWDISNMTEAQQKMARERALFDAEYATFRDTSAFSAFLTGKKHLLATKQGKTIWGTGFYRMGNMVLEGLMPFVKTPVNIFRRSVDYSPISLFRAIGEMSSKDPEVFKQGIKHLSTGLTGTQIFGLGFYLANSGLVSIDTQLGSHSGSKYYDQDMGYQDYSLVLNIGGKKYSWTIDWLQPMQASLFMGAAFKDMVEDLMDGEGNLGTDVISALFAVTSPMLDASFMSSTKDMIETFQRRAGKETAEGEPDMAGALAMALFGDLPKNYISSAVPQLISQAANTIDPYKRDTRSTLEDPILASWDSAGKQMINRIPVLREKLLNPKIDRWGDDVKTGNNIATRMFFSMINPSNVKDITENKYDRELIRIRNKGTEKGSNDYKFFYYNFTGNPQYELANGKRMTYDELYKYGKSNRIEQTERIHDMMDADSYGGMTWQMKAKEVDDAHWIGQMVADHDTYGVNYAIKALRKSAETNQRNEADIGAYDRYVANAGKDKDNEKFYDYLVNKERMYVRSHPVGKESYRIKALSAIQSGDDNLIKAVKVDKAEAQDARTYWNIVKDEFGKDAKKQAFKEVTDGCCYITNGLKDAEVESTDLGMLSASAGKSAKDGKKIDERVYRLLGHFWNSAQAGGGLQLKYNKNGKYDLKSLEAMGDQLNAKLDNRGDKSQKDVVCDFIENDLGITNADEAACVYQVLYLKGNGKRWKNPYKDTINDWLEWGDNHDEDWGVDSGSGNGGRGYGHRRRGGGGGSGRKGKMPKTDSGAFNGKVTNPFSTSNGSSASNLNNAYRKKAKKSRESLYKGK